MNKQDIVRNSVSEKAENHSVIVGDQLYDLDVKQLKKITKNLEAVAKPRRVKVRVFKGRIWTAEEIKILGTDIDEAIATKIGVSTSAVASKRRELSVPPFRSPGNPSQRNWTDDEIAILGKYSDSEVAEKLKVSITTIGNKRRALGIRRYTKPTRVWTNEEISLLGQIPDKVLAKQLGVPNHIVFFKRKSLDIVAFNRTVQEEEKPRTTPEIDKDEEAIATQVYNLYDEAKSIIQAVAKIKKFSKTQDANTMKKVGAYLAAKYQENFALERCLTLVGIY